MSKLIYDAECEKLVFGLSLLEDQLLQICLPYLEAGENKILEDIAFIGDIKRMNESLRPAMSRYNPGVAIEVWNEVNQRIRRLSFQAKASDVLFSAMAVMVVRCTFENLNKPGQSITIARSRSHPAFHSKLEEMCKAAGMPMLVNLSDDSEMRNLAAVLRT